MLNLILILFCNIGNSRIMKLYKKTILICLLVSMVSCIGLYYVAEEPWRSILSGLFTGAIVTVITALVSYNIKKEEIFTNIGKELLITYNRLSYLYSQLIKCSNALKNSEESPSIIYKEIMENYKVYEKYMQSNHFDFALNNYDGLLFSNLITKFFVSNEVRVLVEISDLHQINNQYALICGKLSLMRAQLNLAENTGNIEQIDKLINQVDAQYKYSLNVIPQQLAFINHAMQHFEQVRKLGKTWNVIKQDILNSNGLFDNQINDAEHNLQEEYKWNKK